MIPIASEQITIFEFLPGYKFKVRFQNDYSTEKFKTEVSEDLEYNLKFNKNSDFTFDNFVAFFLQTEIEEKVKRLIVDIYTLDFVVYNLRILDGTGFENFGEGLVCTSVTNSSGKLNPELYVKFCEEANIKHLKPLYEGYKQDEGDFFANMMNMSKFSPNARCYGLSIRGTYDDYEHVIMSEDKDFVDATRIDRAEELLEEIVGMKATSDFVMESVKKYGVTLSNVTRVYNSIMNNILVDIEFSSYRDEILKSRDQQWFNTNLRKQIKKHFGNLVSQIRGNI